MSELVENTINKLTEYFGNNQRINLMPYMMAKNGDFYLKRDLNLTTDSTPNIEEMVHAYHSRLAECLTDPEFYSWNEEGTAGCLFYKPFLAEENQCLLNLNAHNQLDRNRFLRSTSYDQRFFCIKISLSRTESIHLYQKIRSSKETKKWYHIPIFADRNRMQIADHTSGFTIYSDFDFSCFFDNTQVANSYSIVHNRKFFERFFGYLQRYKDAFDLVQERFEYIDFSYLPHETEDLHRQCYSLLRFPDLQRCLTELTRELQSRDQTLSKTVLDEKGIPYAPDIHGNPILKPQNPSQAKFVIRMLSDKLALTHYCRTNIMAKSYDRFRFR